MIALSRPLHLVGVLSVAEALRCMRCSVLAHIGIAFVDARCGRIPLGVQNFHNGLEIA